MDHIDDYVGVPSAEEIDRILAEPVPKMSEEDRRRYGDNHVRAALAIIGGLAEYEGEHGPVPGDALTLNAARSYIANVRWQFATTMPQWPHEYTVRDWALGRDRAFVGLVELIHSKGEVKPWPKHSESPRYHHAYLVIDDWQYWTMGSPVQETTVINRARMDSPGAA
jgi:hypothetical protein